MARPSKLDRMRPIDAAVALALAVQGHDRAARERLRHARADRGLTPRPRCRPWRDSGPAPVRHGTARTARIAETEWLNHAIRLYDSRLNGRSWARTSDPSVSKTAQRSRRFALVQLSLQVIFLRRSRALQLRFAAESLAGASLAAGANEPQPVAVGILDDELVRAVRRRSEGLGDLRRVLHSGP
jgi:hypothetical protein